MSLLEDATRSAILLGTGQAATRHAARMLEYRTPLVAAVRPGGGGRFHGLPVYAAVAEAVDETGATAAIAFLPPQTVADALADAASAGIRLAVCVTEGVAAHDTLRALEAADGTGMLIVGPNSPGLALPHLSVLLGFLPVEMTAPGGVAILSRSGTLSYEVVLALAGANLGVSAWVGVGGDRIKGSTFSDLLPLVCQLPETEQIVLVGEVGGDDEERVAETLAALELPTAALIAGRYAPAGVAVGHAGAIIEDGRGMYKEKVAALTAAGVAVVSRPTDIPEALTRQRTGAPT